MKNKKKFLKPYKRKVHIGGKEWSYQINASKLPITYVYLKIRPEKPLETHTISLRNGSHIDDEYFDETVYIGLKPSMVKEIIEQFILKTKPKLYIGEGTKEKPIDLWFDEEADPSEVNKTRFILACKS